MSESERIDYLIKVLAGNNARNFATKAKIRPDTLSRARNGKGKPSLCFERILGAFPGVSREWLYSGIGEPMEGEREKGELLARMESLEKEVGRLADAIERLCQQSANRKK